MRQSALTVILPFLIVAGAVSCTKEGCTVPCTDEEVEFALSDSPEQTKALADGSIPDTYALCVSARLTDNTNPRNNMNYFTGHRFAYSGSTWKASPAIFWPYSGYLDFLALATEPGGTDLQAGCAWSSPDASKGVTVDIADGDNLKSEILFGRSSSKNTGHVPAAMVLYHAQNLQRFNVWSNANDLIRIDKIVVHNAFTGGQLQVNNQSFLVAEWTFRGHHQVDVEVPGSQNVVVMKEKKTFDMLLPEQPARKITIYYKRRNLVTDDWSTAAFTETLGYTPELDTWWYGNRYEYNIYCKLDRIYLTVSVNPWGADSRTLGTSDFTD